MCETDDLLQLRSRARQTSDSFMLQSIQKGEGIARVIQPDPCENFKPLKSPNQMGDLYISSPISRDDVLNDEYFESYKRNLITILLIETKIENKDVGPLYNFSKTFIGSSYILFPFRCFVEAVSKLPHLRLRARILHLIQSPGMGKTRLCFELLKELKRGIYCVYRSNGRTGYPSTRPWLGELIEAFKRSTSNENSVFLCLQFIEQAIMKYKSLDDATISSEFVRGFYAGSSSQFEQKFLYFNAEFSQWKQTSNSEPQNK